MTTDVYGRVLTHDGEGVHLDDLNDMASRPLAIVWDQLVRELISNRALVSAADEDSVIDRSTIPYAIALTTMRARPAQGSGFNKVKITAGVLLQAIAAAPTGTEPTVLAYTFSGTDEVTIANGDVTNPRVDLVQMKLEYVDDTPTTRDFQDAITRAVTSNPATLKRRRVQCTLSVKQGTPAASPTYPTLDAGCVAIAGLVVGANCVHAFQPQITDTAGAVMVIHDQRLPVSVRGTIVSPATFVADYLNGRADAVNGFSVGRDRTDGVPSNILAPLLRSGNTGRLVQISAIQANVGAIVTKFLRYPGFANDSVSNPIVSLAGAGLNAITTPASRRTPAQFAFQADHQPEAGAGPTVIANAAGVGAPIWTNGHRAPAARFDGEFDAVFPIEHSMLAMGWIDTPSSTYTSWVTFWIAEGL